MPARPNLLLIVADDQTHRSIGALNNPAVHTPHLDRLVARGTCFTHAFHQGSWTGAVCVASRAMLHTGRPIFRCGGENCGDHVLLGEHLQAHGYHTRSVGKWHNGGTSQPRKASANLQRQQGGRSPRRLRLGLSLRNWRPEFHRYNERGAYLLA